MNWLRENRWLGTFLIGFAICTFLALYFLFRAKTGFDDASVHFKEVAAERNRLEHLDPFPDEASYRKMKVHFENYGIEVNNLKDELKTQMLPVTPLAPNEFQSRLRQAIIAITEKARANRVRLPDNFQLGFDEFTTALPNTAAAPLLGQELAQVEFLLNIVIDARVDGVKSFRRMPPPPEATAAATPAATRKPAAAEPKVITRNVVDLTFAATPSAARKVLNQIASSDRQLFIIRTLHMRNEQEKGPRRESSPAVSAVETAQKPSATGAIKFIVGNEHIQTAARIEMVGFNF